MWKKLKIVPIPPICIQLCQYHLPTIAVAAKAKIDIMGVGEGNQTLHAGLGGDPYDSACLCFVVFKYNWFYPNFSKIEFPLPYLFIGNLHLVTNAKTTA